MSTTRGKQLLTALAAVALVTVAGCDGDQGGGDGTSGTSRSGGGILGLGGGEDTLRPALSATAPGALTAGGTTADEISRGASAALFTSAPVAVLAAPGHEAQAASAGVVLGVPVLADGPGSTQELQRLGTEVVLAVGPVADPGVDVIAPASDEELADLLGAGSPVSVPAQELPQRLAELDPASPQLLVAAGAWPVDDTAATSSPGAPAGGASTTDDTAATSAPAPGSPTATTTPAPLTPDRDDLPPTERAEPLAGLTVLTTGAPEQLPALATARAAGAQVVSGPHTDPRADATTVQALAESEPATVLGLGDGYGDSESLAWKVRTAATGVELPGGGQLVLPGKTYVALYGTPSTSALGVLGEQPAEQTIARAEEHAGWYADLVEGPVVPTLEIIATVASGDAGPDGNYSNELPVADLVPLIDLAQERGQYVVIDLQPGRADFLTQAKMYEPLLTRPHVGLALDPEWRLTPDQVPLQQIGSVDVAEVNEVADWLAELTREHDLPQKAFVVHMFRSTMVSDVTAIDQSHDELATLIHVDGQGPQGDKQGTWSALHEAAPTMRFWGWKNFYDEDVPMLTAAETVAQVLPAPAFISYQ